MRAGFQTRILVAAVASREAPKVLFTLLVSGAAALLLTAIRWSLSLTRAITRLPTTQVEHLLKSLGGRVPNLGSLTTAFEHVLSRDTLFGSTPVTAVARSGLDVVINACDLRTGTAFRFGSQGSGGWRYGRIDDARIPVAKAVAASAAYPLLLPPLRETFSFVRGEKRVKDTVILTDGGVFDNLGVTVLEPGRNPDISVNVHKPDYIICLNASAGQLEGTDSPTWWPARVARSFETVHRKAQDGAYGRLHRYIETGELAGFVMVYLGQDDSRLPVKPPDLVPRSAVHTYPTDFSPMSDKNIALLATRGEQLTRLLLDHYAAQL